MRQELSIHDNDIHGYTVDCEGRRPVLHTAFRDRAPLEYTDIVFGDVLALHFEHLLAGNILFDIEESEVATLVQDNKDLFADSWRYGWQAVGSVLKSPHLAPAR